MANCHKQATSDTRSLLIGYVLTREESFFYGGCLSCDHESVDCIIGIHH